jgi:aryl-alcohol dehydrogenase-like predicted oxidoreductase
VRLNGVALTQIGLGTNRLTDTPENRAFVAEAVEAGVNFIDTAHVYTGGESERAIGAALAPFPEDLIVATKGGMGDGGARTLAAEIDESLRRLQTEAIDLYYLHRVDARVPLETSIEALNDHRERGKIRHIGLSEVSIEQIERARRVAPIASVQNRYNLSERSYEDVVDHCAEQELLFVPFYPLRAGLDSSVVREIATSHDATPAQIALAWLLRRSPAMLPIPGTLSSAHLRENMAAVQIELTDEQFEALR